MQIDKEGEYSFFTEAIDFNQLYLWLNYWRTW